MNAVKVQAQIRANSEEVANFVNDLGKWEKDMSKKDQAIRQSKARKAVCPPRAGSGTVQVLNVGPPAEKAVSAAKHTYDVGYKKWENFKEDEDENTPSTGEANCQTPASITQAGLPTAAPRAAVPRARGVASAVDAEATERERGNDEFKAGNFNAAVKLYTKCLGMKVKNYIAFSNRAMAYLKLKEFSKAEADCTCALSINPEHVKSLSRRATARNALGKHRAAVGDLMLAETLEPSNKVIKSDLAKARELLRNAVSRAPLIEMAVSDQDIPEADSLQGPDMPAAGFTRVVIDDGESESSSAVKAPQPVNSATIEPPVAPETTKPVNKPAAAAKPEKKASTKKASAPKKVGATSGGYDLERSLRMYKGQTALMEKYLDTLSLTDVPTLMNNLMEGDVVATLLIEMGKLQGTKRGNWEVVIDWFESISKVPSFGLLVSLVSASDKEQLSAVLDRSIRVVSEDALDLPAKVDKLKEAYLLM